MDPRSKTAQTSIDLAQFPHYAPMDETGTIDLSQIDVNNSLTPAERIRRFAEFLELCDAFREAGIIQRQRTTKTDDSSR